MGDTIQVMDTPQLPSAKRTSSRPRRLVAALVGTTAVVTLSAGLVVGSLVTTAGPSGEYELSPSGRLGESGNCVSTSLSGTLTTRRGLLGDWRQATPVNQKSAVSVADCVTGSPAAVDKLVVAYSWAETGGGWLPRGRLCMQPTVTVTAIVSGRNYDTDLSSGSVCLAT